MSASGAAPRVAELPTARRLRAFEAYGLELEYALVSRDALDVLPIADQVLELAGGAPGSGDVDRGVLGWSNELVRHVVELKNVAPRPLAELTGRFQHEVAHFNALLASRGAQLMPGGMHPWMDPATQTQLWPHGNAAVYRAYDRIFGCSAHGWANLQSTHINLPFADEAEFARLHAAVRVVLPIIPALAASSPYAEGRAVGPLDYRMHVYASNSARVPSLAGDVVPEPVSSRAEYEQRILQPMYRDIASLDPDGVLQHEWLNSRGAIARFSRDAIEIRVMDVQECPLADVALAGLVIDVVRAMYEERFAPLASQHAVSQAVLARVLQACIDKADRAAIAEPEYLRIFGIDRAERSAGALWASLAQRLDASGAEHQALWAVPVDLVLSRGPLARRLLEALGSQPSRAKLRLVYARLCQGLGAGRMFVP